jgi:hypothetical protein
MVIGLVGHGTLGPEQAIMARRRVDAPVGTIKSRMAISTRFQSDLKGGS